MMLYFDYFQLDYSLESWTTLKFLSIENLFIKARAITFLFIVLSSSQ